jgi:hypothetical protein
MPELFHQTVRLSRGRHSSPVSGMCVMELASTLAGEPFSDHPQAVCPVIGAFLRTYNDRVDDAARQDLIPFAAEVVGTRADAHVERLRAQTLVAWAIEEMGAGIPRWRWRRRRLARGAAASTGAGGRSCATWAAAIVPTHSPTDHARVLAVLRRLIAVAAHDSACTLATAVAGPAAGAPATAEA